jgi:hypothetical protein
MEKLLYSIDDKTITVLNNLSEWVLNDSYIVVIHCNKIPPHIGLLANNLFYSLKSSGKDNGIDFQHLKMVLNKKQIATLFFELKTGLDSHTLQTFFDVLPEFIPTNETCLSPIKEVLKAPKEIEHIGELLTFLENIDGVNQCFGLNLPDNYKGVPFYTKEDIKKRIDYLQHAKRKEGIA